MKKSTRAFSINESFACYAAATVIYLAAGVVSGAVRGHFDDGSVGYWLCIALTNAVLGVVALAFAYTRRKDELFAALKINKPSMGLLLCGFAVIIGLMFFMTPIINWLYDLIEAVGLPRPTVALEREFVPLLLTATAVPAFSEELLFRGVIGNGFTYHYGRIKGSLLCGALFALFHANPAQTVYQFALGSFLTLIVYDTDSLWMSIILHFANNLISVIGEFAIPQDVYEHPLTCACGAVVCGIALFVYFKYTQKDAKTAKEAQNDGEKETLRADVATYATVCAVVFIVLWMATLLG